MNIRKKIKIKNQLLLLVGIILLLSCNFKTPREPPTLNPSSGLIGIWNYIETRNYSGGKIKSFEHNTLGKITTSGPKIILNNDGSYKKVFDSLNVDDGFWSYNKKTLAIEYDLFIDSTDWIGKDLIKEGLAIKHDDGLYYERLEDKVIEFEKGHLILDVRGNQQVYEKEN